MSTPYHRRLKHKAEQSFHAVYHDGSVSKETRLQSLEDLLDGLELLIYGLKAELEIEEPNQKSRST